MALFGILYYLVLGNREEEEKKLSFSSRPSDDDAPRLSHGLAELLRAVDDVVGAKVLDLAVRGRGHGRRPEKLCESFFF